MRKEFDVEKMRHITKLLSYSPMPKQEKAEWLKLLPEMNSEHLERFESILERETNRITEVALNLFENQRLAS